jgi:hypothetical protein
MFDRKSNYFPGAVSTRVALVVLVVDMDTHSAHLELWLNSQNAFRQPLVMSDRSDDEAHLSVAPWRAPRTRKEKAMAWIISK